MRRPYLVCMSDVHVSSHGLDVIDASTAESNEKRPYNLGYDKQLYTPPPSDLVRPSMPFIGTLECIKVSRG